MATEEFKSAMELLLENYIDFRKHLNKQELNDKDNKDYKAKNIDLSFCQYSDLYIKYADMLNNMLAESGYDEEDYTTQEDRDLEEEPEETY